MKNLNDFAREAHGVAVEHGWWDDNPDHPEIIALIHSELSESLREYRDGKPMLQRVCTLDWDDKGQDCDSFVDCDYKYDGCDEYKPEGVAVELADCALRMLDYCGKQELDIDGAIAAARACCGDIPGWTLKDNDSKDGKLCPLPTLIATCHALVSYAYNGWTGGYKFYFAACINLMEAWLARQGLDLQEVMRQKHEYNKTRPYRHGDKLC